MKRRRQNPPPKSWSDSLAVRRVPGWLAKVAPARSPTTPRHPSTRNSRSSIQTALYASLRADVERLKQNEFDLLGSGPTIVRDAERGERIDWALDFRSGIRFPTGFPLSEWNFDAMKPDGADIKLPWELGRLQHWPKLAFAVTEWDDEEALAELVHQLDDFRAVNPAGVGVQWICTMDVAIRATAMTSRSGPSRTSEDDERERWARPHTHGVFIRSHLENHYEVTSNHYLSNLLGLAHLGELFADLEIGADWLDFALSGIEHETTVQIQADGSDFESSVPTTGWSPSCSFRDSIARHTVARSRRTPARIRLMLTFLDGVLHLDGEMPLTGDIDDGRLHPFGPSGGSLTVASPLRRRGSPLR